MNGTAVFPGFIAVVLGVYITITEQGSKTGWALFSSGLLLETSALQLFIILRKQAQAPEKDK